MRCVSLSIGVLAFMAATVVVAQEAVTSEAEASPAVISISQEEIASRGITTIADLIRETKALEHTFPGGGVLIRIEESSATDSPAESDAEAASPTPSAE